MATSLLSPEQFFGAPQGAAQPQPASIAAPGEEGGANMAQLVPPEQFFGPTPPPVAPSPGSSGRPVGGFADQAVRALTFGLSDKAAAAGTAVGQASKSNAVADTTGTPALPQNRMIGMQDLAGVQPGYAPVTQGALSPGFSDAYHAALAKERGAGETYAEEHPVASKVATTLGTVGSIPMLASASAAAAATLPGRMLQGTKVGTGIGGMAGFGASNDESPESTATEVGKGMVLGGATGAVAPVVAEHVVSPIWNWFARRFSPAAGENQGVQRLMQRISQDASAGGPSAQDMLDLVNAGSVIGKPITLADLGGSNVLGEAGRVARAPGPGKQVAIDTLNARDAGAGTRLAGDVNTGISSGGSAFDTANALDQSRRSAAQPLYEQAYAANQSMVSPEIDRVLSTPAGKEALGRAATKMQNDMSLVGRPDPELTAAAKEAADLGLMAPHGTGVGVASGLKLRTLDYIKQSLDDMIGARLKQGERGDAGILIGLKNKLVRAIDDADVTARAGPNSTKAEGGLYAQARAAYSGPSQSMNALDTGSQIFTKKPEQIAAELADLAPGDREFYKLGAADALKTNIAKTSSGGDEARKIIGSQYTQNQLRPLFSSEAEYNRFINAATAEHRMFGTRLQTIGNSATAGRVAEDDAAHVGGTLGGATEAAAGLMTGEHIPILAGGARMLRNLAANRPPQDPGVNASIARMLFNTNPDENRALLARILSSGQDKSLLPSTTIPLASMAPNALRGYQGPQQPQR